jgi:hypothetical protein
MSTPRRYGRKPAPIIRTSRPLQRAASAAAPSDGSTRGGYPSGSIPILEQITLNPVVVGCCKDIVRLLPRTTSFYATIDPSVELSRRAWDGVSTRAEQHKGVPCRWCRPIVNETGGLVEVPRLKLLLRNTAEQEVSSWTAAPPSHRLPPGQTIAFASRLASPSARSSDVLVRFLNRRDPIADPR